MIVHERWRHLGAGAARPGLVSEEVERGGEATSADSRATSSRILASRRRQFDTRFAGVTRHFPPSAGSIIFVPAGSPIRARPSERNDELHIFVEPGVVERAAAEAFEFDPAVEGAGTASPRSPWAISLLST